MLDDLAQLNAAQPRARSATPRSLTRIAQYEMAFRMQTSVPELTDLSRRARLGPRPVRPRRRASPGTLRRQLPAGPPAGRARRAVHPALPSRLGPAHATCPTQIAGQCRDTDQPSAALVTDLKQRGLLDDTLVIWGGEFGRTVYCQGTLTADELRPRPPSRAASPIWLAGGGIKPGMTYGETDDFCYNIVQRPGPRPRPERDASCTAWASTTRG